MGGNESAAQANGAVEELERSLGVLLRLLGDRETVGDVAQRSGYDLPPASWALLEYLDAYGSMRVSDIAACHGVDVSSVTPRLKRLQNANLVDRKTLPADARVSVISIAPQGRLALESVHNARREFISQAIEDIDAVQIAGAAEVLNHIAARLTNYSTRLNSRTLTGQPK